MEAADVSSSASLKQVWSYEVDIPGHVVESKGHEIVNDFKGLSVLNGSELGVVVYLVEELIEDGVEVGAVAAQKVKEALDSYSSKIASFL